MRLIKDNYIVIFTLSLWVLIILPFTAGCAKRYRIHHGSGIPAGYHQVTEIMELAAKEEIMGTPDVYKVIHEAGIKDEEILNGSIALGRVYCCGGEGTAETSNSTIIYIPPSLSAKKGDIVEFIAGKDPEKGNTGQLNTAIKIRNVDGIASKECRYVPEDPRLWLRVIHCNWMDEEGWQKQGGLNPIYYKPVKQ